LLKASPLVVSVSRIDLEEKICIALGKIGSQEAIPILKEISRKGFLAVKSYHAKVKNAAAKAITSIGNT
jgi:HEAT repeat protein